MRSSRRPSATPASARSNAERRHVFRSMTHPLPWMPPFVAGHPPSAGSVRHDDLFSITHGTAARPGRGAAAAPTVAGHPPATRPVAVRPPGVPVMLAGCMRASTAGARPSTAPQRGASVAAGIDPRNIAGDVASGTQVAGPVRRGAWRSPPRATCPPAWMLDRPGPLAAAPRHAAGGAEEQKGAVPPAPSIGTGIRQSGAAPRHTGGRVRPRPPRPRRGPASRTDPQGTRRPAGGRKRGDVLDAPRDARAAARAGAPRLAPGGAELVLGPGPPAEACVAHATPRPPRPDDEVEGRERGGLLGRRLDGVLAKRADGRRLALLHAERPELGRRERLDRVVAERRLAASS